jgi:tetratricopeptide (TPR) repeat protein
LALFGRKKEEATEVKEAGGGAPAGGDGEPLRQEPEKAARFFTRAKTVHETGNYEYAMTLWLDGMRLDPFNMGALESFFQSCAAFLGEPKNKGVSKETLRQFGGRSDLDRYLRSLLDWGMKPTDATMSVRASAAASNLKLAEATYWLGERALAAILNEKKPRKDLLVKMIGIFSDVGAFDKAVHAGEAACRLDPADGKLAADVRNLAAQATMTKGGYDQTGQAGGFRANVRDLEKQRHLEDAERIVKSEETVDRLVREAEANYNQRPDDVPSIRDYIRRLMERGNDADLARARKVAQDAFAKTKQFSFREMDGDCRLRIAQRNLAKYRMAAEEAPQDEVRQSNYAKAQRKYAEMEIEEFQTRVEAYPTDNKLKLELGRRLFELGRIDESIPLFQKAQHDASRRVEAMFYLAQSFERIEYIDEAVNTYRNAIDAYKVGTDEMGMSLRYGLMTALQAKAEKDRELPAAEEADKLASSIAVQQFDYRDIRQRRDVLKKLIGDLKRGDAA